MTRPRRSMRTRSTGRSPSGSPASDSRSRTDRVGRLLQRLDVRRERPQLLGRDDPAPVRHRDDWRAADYAAAADEVDDLRVRIELMTEVGAGQRRYRLVRRLRIWYAAEAIGAVATDAAVANVE